MSSKQAAPLGRRNRFGPTRGAHRGEQLVEQPLDILRAQAEAGCHAGRRVSASQQLERLSLSRRDPQCAARRVLGHHGRYSRS